MVPRRWWYGVATIWVVNDQAQILCSKRSEQTANGGLWQTYFGGHVQAGQSFQQTAVIELAEEAGIKIQLTDLQLVETGRKENLKVMFERFMVRFNGRAEDLNLQDDEITDARWMSMDQAERHKSIPANQWCNECTPEQKKLILERL